MRKGDLLEAFLAFRTREPVVLLTHELALSCVFTTGISPGLRAKKVQPNPHPEGNYSDTISGLVVVYVDEIRSEIYRVTIGKLLKTLNSILILQ